MSSPRKEAKKENEEHDKDDEENPTNVGPGITESMTTDLFFLMCPALSKGLYQ